MSSSLVCWLFACLLGAEGYSKVSLYGQPRSAAAQDIAFTLSPVYAASQRTTLDLRPGEAVNHPSTAKYPSDQPLDQPSTARKNAQERFRPPAKFEHAIMQLGPLRQQNTGPRPEASSKDVIYTKPVVSMAYYPPAANFDSGMMPSKPPPAVPLPSYAQPKPSNNEPADQIIYSSKPPDFDVAQPPKSLDFPEHYSPYDDGGGGSPAYGHSPYHEDDIVYDHIPDEHHYQHYHHPHHHHHHHHRPSTTTPEPEMMDQRLNKRPYSYYYIGKKLWYVPLYFSIYFIIYIAALVLKSIARHKINFPANLAAVANQGARSDSPGWTDYAVKALEAIEKYAVKS